MPSRIALNYLLDFSKLTGCLLSVVPRLETINWLLVNSLGLVKFFLDPKGGSQNATLVVVVLGISSLKIPKASLIRSAARRNFANTSVHRARTPYRSAVSDF